MSKIKLTPTYKIILPQKGYQVTFCNVNKKSPLDILIKINQTENIEEIKIIQQAGSPKWYNILYKEIEDKKINIEFYMSDFIIKMSKGTLPAIKKFKAPLKFGTTHVKLILIKTKQGNNYIIDSSSNMGSNSKIEYTEITNNLTTYNFFTIFANKYFK